MLRNVFGTLKGDMLVSAPGQQLMMQTVHPGLGGRRWGRTGVVLMDKTVQADSVNGEECFAHPVSD